MLFVCEFEFFSPCDMSQVTCNVTCRFVLHSSRPMEHLYAQAQKYTCTQSASIYLPQIYKRHAYLTLMLLSNDFFCACTSAHIVCVCVDRTVHRSNGAARALCNSSHRSLHRFIVPMHGRKSVHTLCVLLYKNSVAFFFEITSFEFTYRCYRHKHTRTHTRALRTDSDQKFKQLYSY